MLLQKIPRLNFENFEKIIKQLRISVTEEQKIIAASRHTLFKSEEERGNTCGPFEKVVNKVRELDNFEVRKIEESIIKATHLFYHFEYVLFVIN